MKTMDTNTDDTVSNKSNSKKRKPSFLPPSDFEELFSSYRFEWEARKRRLSPPLQVTSLCCCYNNDNNNALLLLVGTNLGSVIVYQQQQDEDESSSSWICQREVKLGKDEITFLHYAPTTNTTTSAIVAGGLGGIWWWKDASEMLASSSTNYKKLQVVHAQAAATAATTDDDLRLFITTPEQSLFQIDLLSNKDMKQIHFPASSSPLPLQITALHLTPSSTSTTTSTSTEDECLLLIGTNQSQVFCWNVKRESFSKNKVLMLQNDDNDSNKATTATTRVTAITSIHSDWWIIAGTTSNSTTTKTTETNNFIGTWHGPTQSRIKLNTIRETIRGLMVFENQSLCSIGNEKLLTVWDSPYQLEQRVNRIRTSAPSNKVVMTIPMPTATTANENKDSIVVVGGVGSKIDLIQRQVCIQSLDLLQGREERLELEGLPEDETKKQ